MKLPSVVCTSPRGNKLCYEKQTPYLSQLNFSNAPGSNNQFDKLRIHNQLDIFPVRTFQVWTRVKYDDGPCLTTYSPSTLYRDIVPCFWSGGFTIATAVNQTDRILGNFILVVHFDTTFLSTLTGILDLANLIFQT